MSTNLRAIQPVVAGAEVTLPLERPESFDFRSVPRMSMEVFATTSTKRIPCSAQKYFASH